VKSALFCTGMSKLIHPPLSPEVGRSVAEDAGRIRNGLKFEGAGMISAEEFSSVLEVLTRGASPQPTPLRILHVIFSSQLAGSERYCADLANLQSEAGHEVHVAGARGSLLERALAPGIRYHAFATPFFRRFRLKRLVGTLDPDVCHGHLSPACKALAGLPDSRATVATLHVGYKAHQHARLGALICVNQAQGRRLGDYQGLVRVIPNWIPKSRGGLPTRALRQELGLSEKTFVVGAVGRLHPSKGMDVLIDAFQSMAPPEAALVILGEGPQRRDLERRVGTDPRIHLLGYRSDVHACFGSFDLFISPSREESFGLAILEAMSSGVPVIATAAEGPAEFLREFPVKLVAPGSVEELAAALAAAGEKFRAGALPRVAYDLGGFEAPARLSSIQDLYAQLIKSKPPVGWERATGRVVAS
jgi:glycosyltransferase involved in cell wall biosynthesis